MGRKLFCEISPLAYKISVVKERAIRHAINALSPVRLASQKGKPLPVLVYSHNSLIRRRLGNVDMQLQENKAVNLGLAAPKVTGILIRPGETFSFWKLAGKSTATKGYKEGLVIKGDGTGSDMGGGMCQFTNLLHWLVLHSPLDIVEHHHHDGLDLFPDYGRQVPFGCGTSIMYNYLDYRVTNNTDNTFQFITFTSETHLCGELRALEPLDLKFHIEEKNLHFVRVSNSYYRKNQIYQRVIDKRTGREVENRLVKESNALVIYDEAFIPKELLRAQ